MKLWRYLRNVAVGVDQLGNALLAGDPDETVSSRLERLRVKHGGRIPWHHPWARLLARALETIDPGHLARSLEPGEGGDQLEED